MDFPLPPVGEGLIEVELVRWLVRPGDAVSRGQGLAEVMSDKATMEVPAPFAGTVTALAATPGTKVKVGEVLLSYEPVGEWRRPPPSARPPPRGKGEPSRAEPRQRGAGAPAPVLPSEGAAPEWSARQRPTASAGKLPPAAPVGAAARPQARHRSDPDPRQRPRRPHPDRRPRAAT